MHADEKARIKELAGKDATKEARLTAAACAAIKCYAQYPVDSEAYQKLKQLADIGNSPALSIEREQLAKQSGLFGYTSTGIITDERIDTVKKINNTYQIDIRALGAGQTVIGAFGVAGALGTAPVSCVTGIGCIANAVGGTISFDVGYAGAKQVVSGTPQSTFLNQGLQSLGMSPEAADIVAAGLGIGSAVTAIAGANKALDQAIALGKLSGGSYQTFATNGVKVTSEVLETPQAVALVKEIQAGNPGITTRDAIDYATGYIGSGTALPIAGIAAQGSNLVKAVPKGDRVSDFSGYWMSPQQAREIAIMTPEQAGRLLGLPAAQAANILVTVQRELSK
jgi:filamentous hemagglutinin